MSLVLHVDAARWRGHLRAVAAATPGLVPVVKGNGYGLGRARLASEAADLGLDTIAVGTYTEVPGLADAFPGDLLVLTPWRPFEVAAGATAGTTTGTDAPARRVVHTVGRLVDLDALLLREPDAHYVLERVTSMRRHGLTAPDLRAAAARVGDGLRGVSFHLPLAGSNLAEARRLMTDVVAAELPTRTVFASHLAGEDLAALRSSYADYTVRPRVGTDLWLGDRGALRVTSTVLDVHPVERGDAFGYRARTAPRAGTVLVVSGGTAHGIGLESPSGDLSLRSRAATLARGGLDAAGFVRSPYSVDGKQRLFAEPPHMQASMLFVPAGPRVPEVGEEIEVRVRYTATDVDEVVFS